jgi:FkbM family methyltransferase
MKSYSQYEEDIKILNFFNDRKGNLLDIGANDGRTISNSLLFIEEGWSGVLVEGSHITFEKLKREHKDNKNVHCVNTCLSDKIGKTTFYHNLNHFGNGDTDLLSTIVKSNYEDSSRGFAFTSFEVDCVDFNTFYKDLPIKKFNYVSIDIEGMDLIILKQMDLQEIGVELLIIEYNNITEVKNEIIEYCSKFDINNILIDNGVNLVLYKK